MSAISHTSPSPRSHPAELAASRPPRSLYLQRLEAQILASYAHNSLVYTTLAEVADLTAITHFLRWDAEQPAFSVYLRRWLPKTPSLVRGELEEHIRVEEDERHSQLFQEMLARLISAVPSEPTLDERVLEELNYTFSARCAAEEDLGFFLGGFWATELMSAKRCHQLFLGLRRANLAPEELTYLEIHFRCDASHGEEVRDKLILPMLEQTPSLLASVQRGVHDRLSRSATYLRWYELERLPLSAPAGGGRT
ncbi:MAG: iron-containing redox enzyme family protein [Kofleriaceae bacterium]